MHSTLENIVLYPYQYNVRSPFDLFWGRFVLRNRDSIFILLRFIIALQYKVLVGYSRSIEHNTTSSGSEIVCLHVVFECAKDISICARELI